MLRHPLITRRVGTYRALVLLTVLACGRILAGADTDWGSTYGRTYELEAKGLHAQALKALALIEGKEKTSYFFLLRSAWLNYCNARYEAAVSYYDKAIRAAPSALEPLLGKLKAQIALENWENAQETAQLVVKMDQENYTARSALAYAYFLQRRYAASQEAYEDVLEFYPSDLTMQAGLGWALRWQGKRSEALKAFRAILEVSPTHAGATEALGENAPIVPNPSAEAYQRSYKAESAGEYASALKALDGITAAGKQTYFFALRSAWLRRKNGQQEEAAVAYAQAAKLAPFAVEPLLGKLQIEIELKKWADAVKTAVAILDIDARNYSARSNLAYAWYFLNGFKEAERIYGELVKEYPGDLSIRSGLAWSQLSLGKKAEAISGFKAILQVCPSHELAKKGLETSQTSNAAER